MMPVGFNGDKFNEEQAQDLVRDLNKNGQKSSPYPNRHVSVDRALEEAAVHGMLAPDGGFVAGVSTDDIGEPGPVVHDGILPDSAGLHNISPSHPLRNKS